MTRITVFAVAGLAAWFGSLAQPAAQTDQEPNLLYATELIQQAEVQARAIGEMSFVAGVEAVDVGELPREDASEAIFVDTMDRFTTRYDEEVARLRGAIAGNPVVAEALAGAGVELSDVVAAEIRDDLSLVVYTYEL